MKKNKKTGEIYTNLKYVIFTLEEIDYIPSNYENILNKKVIDNSCGSGAFLMQIVENYILAYLISKGYKELEDLLNLSKKEINILIEQLTVNIVGVEINTQSFNETINNLNNLLLDYNEICNKSIFPQNINWNIINEDFLIEYPNHVNNYDYVIGNPPYIRLHDLENKNLIKKIGDYKGVIDLYLIFLELGLELLSETGQLIYITPNSYFQNKSFEQFREKIINNQLLTKIININNNEKLFRNATVYPAITLLSKTNNQKQILYKETSKKTDKYEIKKYNDFYINNKFYLIKNNNQFQNDQNNKNLINLLKENNQKQMMCNMNRNDRKYKVKNTLVTGKDNFYIQDFKIKNELIKQVYKCSNGIFSKILYPYDINGKLIEFQNLDIEIQNLLLQHKTELLNRSLKGNKWYGYTRNQALNDMNENRLCINNLMSPNGNVKLHFAKKGEIVYSGLYIVVSDLNEYKKLFNKIVMDKNFQLYVKMLNKHKQGGYYSFSNKDLEEYLNLNE